MMGQNERPVLLQKFFKVLSVEHANAEFFQFGRRPTGQALFRPARQRAETLFNLPAEHRQFAFLHTAFEFAAQDLVVQDVIENWHLTRLLFHSVTFSKSWPKRPHYALSGSGQVMVYSTLAGFR